MRLESISECEMLCDWSLVRNGWGYCASSRTLNLDITVPQVIHNETRLVTIRNLLKVYMKRNPVEFKLFVEQVNKERSHLLNELAMSEAGYYLKLMEIPAKVFYMMNHVFGNNWIDDPKTASAFLEVFKFARMNMTSTPTFSKVEHDTEPKPLVYDPREIIGHNST